MASFHQPGASRKLGYLGASLAVGVALAVAEAAVGIRGADAPSPDEQIAPPDAVVAAAVAPAMLVGLADQMRLAQRIPAELLAPPESAANLLLPLFDAPASRKSVTGVVPVPASVPMPRKRPPAAARDVPSPRPAPANAQIARLKTALKLTPDQERYWPPVEAVLRDIVTQAGHRPAGSRPDASGVYPVDHETLQRLTAVAMPLIMTFDETQRTEVRRLARAIGLENVASAI